MGTEKVDFFIKNILWEQWEHINYQSIKEYYEPTTKFFFGSVQISFLEMKKNICKNERLYFPAAKYSNISATITCVRCKRYDDAREKAPYGVGSSA